MLTDPRYGGVKTDLHARVLSTNDIPIPGLWAAGEMTGLFYNEYPPATSCLRSMAFGRIAGLEIAQNLGGKHGQANGPAIPSEKRADSGAEMDMGQKVLDGE